MSEKNIEPTSDAEARGIVGRQSVIRTLKSRFESKLSANHFQVEAAMAETIFHRHAPQEHSTNKLIQGCELEEMGTQKKRIKTPKRFELISKSK